MKFCNVSQPCVLHLLWIPSIPIWDLLFLLFEIKSLLLLLLSKFLFYGFNSGPQQLQARKYHWKHEITLLSSYIAVYNVKLFGPIPHCFVCIAWPIVYIRTSELPIDSLSCDDQVMLQLSKTAL